MIRSNLVSVGTSAPVQKSCRKNGLLVVSRETPGQNFTRASSPLPHMGTLCLCSDSRSRRLVAMRHCQMRASSGTSIAQFSARIRCKCCFHKVSPHLQSVNPRSKAGIVSLCGPVCLYKRENSWKHLLVAVRVSCFVKTCHR